MADTAERAAAPAAALSSTARDRDARARIAVTLMAASGFAALGYQIVWTQQAALWLGHEAAAVFAVVGAFFGGIALGALALGPRIDRSERPARWYAACEAGIGVWGLALALLMAPVTQALLALVGAQPSPAWHACVAFGGTLLLLLPATAAMGATLPAMERVLAGMRADGAPIARLYAGNTAGAVVGVLAAAFWLVPEFGLLRTAIACALLNFACAATTAWVFRERTSAAARAVATAGSDRVLLTLALTGLLGIGYEVLAVRVLSQVAENTVYTFAILLAVYLVGTAAGAAAYDRWIQGVAPPDVVRDRLLCLLATACLVGTLGMAASPAIKPAFAGAFGASLASALSAEAALALVAFLLPTLAMGALFSHLATTARMQGIGFGRALGVNTAGAALAPMLVGALLLMGAGTNLALLLTAAGYLALASRSAWTAPPQWVAACGLLLLALIGPSLAIIDVPPGGRVLRYDEGILATVTVVEDASGVARLHINNRQQEGSSATLLADARQALLPILLHPAPRRALFLGLGTGVTAFSAADDRSLAVDAVELLPEVIAASDHFTRLLRDAGRSERVHVATADARRFVRATPSRYDVIVADNFHPARSGAGALYTVEHFTAIRERLAEGGVFCQWLPLHQLDLPTLRVIVRSFLIAFPQGTAMLATNSLDTPVIGLVGRAEGDRFAVNPLRGRLATIASSQPPAAFGVPDDLALFGGFIAGPRSLARFAGDAPLNTDDHPVVTYMAPHVTYAPDSLPRDRLLSVLRELAIAPDELVANPGDPAWEARLAAYWRARDYFIAAGRNVQPSGDVRRMLVQVREPLLATLRTSPDFRPAYDPLLRMAIVLARIDADDARHLLLQLRDAQPQRPEAVVALREIAATR